MSQGTAFSTILVPMDFSLASQAAFRWAARLVGGDDRVLILVHVIDTMLVDTIVDHDLGERDRIVSRLRNEAEQKMAELVEAKDEELKIDTLICEGVPFVEIIQKAHDFAVDAVVMSKVGRRHHFETLLFGSTAEKVTRGCRQPVLVLPSTEGSQD